MGDNCDTCKDLYFNLQLLNPLGCDPCNCSKAGILNGITLCDKSSGACLCKPTVEGRRCDVCKDGYYQLNVNNVFGCKRK